jgi:transposase
MSGLQELKTQHREVARLKFEGYQPSEISERLGMSLQTVYGIQSDPLFKQELARLNDKADEEVVNVRRRLSEMSVKAVEKLDTLLDSGDDRIVLRASQDVLDRAGFSAKQRHEHLHAHTTFDQNKVEELKERAKMAGAVIQDYDSEEEDGEVIDSDFSEESSP